MAAKSLWDFMSSLANNRWLRQLGPMSSEWLIEAQGSRRFQG